jgi:hypothetical protein
VSVVRAAAIVAATVVLVLAAACTSGPIPVPQDAASPTGGLGMDLWIARVDSQRYEFFRVHPDGRLEYGGGVRAFGRGTDWSGQIPAEDARKVRQAVDEAGWLTAEDPSRTGAKTPIAEIVLRAGGKERTLTIAGESAEVDRIADVLRVVASRRFDSFMQRLPEAGPQPAP